MQATDNLIVMGVYLHSTHRWGPHHHNLITQINALLLLLQFGFMKLLFNHVDDLLSCNQGHARHEACRYL